MSRTTDLYLKKQEMIQNLLEALQTAKQENMIIWCVNQLQDLGYNFPQAISDNDLEAMENQEPF